MFYSSMVALCMLLSVKGTRYFFLKISSVGLVLTYVSSGNIKLTAPIQPLLFIGILS